ncbi:metallopeptidase family protein [Thalassiella azotivora]
MATSPSPGPRPDRRGDAVAPAPADGARVGPPRPTPATGPGPSRRRPRRRDRHGRGLRGPLLPAGLPGARTRSERFDELVLDAVDRVAGPWRPQVDAIELVVEDVPPGDPSPWEAGEIPLGRVFPAERDLPSRVVVYRRPVETRATDEQELADLVRDVVVEQLAHALGVDPERLDPGFGG